MRRILLAAFAVLLLHAAPSMAAECTNLALATNGGTATASSSWGFSYPATLVNDDLRIRYWNDNTNGVYPDWVQVAWSTPRAINRLRLRAPIWSPATPIENRTIARSRVQYWDDGAATWVDIAGEYGQPNPILDWVGPIQEDGTEVRQFDFATLTTSKVRVLVEDGAADGWSFVEELQAYLRDGTCDAPGDPAHNLALDGVASASSVHSSGSYPVSGVNNGERESGASQGYWNDDTNGTWPDWVQVAWAEPVTVNRLVARIPLARPDFPVGEITLRRTRIQYWNDATSAWVDVAGRSGQANPIVDWTGPVDRYDGSETRTFDFAPATTTKIRALIEDGSTDGWSWLDELEAYCVECTATPTDVNLSLAAHGGSATASSTFASWNPAALNNGRRETSSDYYWNDNTRWTFPDWAQIGWARPKSLNRIVVRGPAFTSNGTIGYRTLGRTRVQWWDESSAAWVDVVGDTGQDNPILNWVMPVGADGSEIRQFDFDPVWTTRVRVLIEDGATDGWSFLEEIETYLIS